MQPGCRILLRFQDHIKMFSSQEKFYFFFLYLIILFLWVFVYLGLAELRIHLFQSWSFKGSGVLILLGYIFSLITLYWIILLLIHQITTEWSISLTLYRLIITANYFNILGITVFRILYRVFFFAHRTVLIRNHLLIMNRCANRV